MSGSIFAPPPVDRLAADRLGAPRFGDYLQGPLPTVDILAPRPAPTVPPTWIGGGIRAGWNELQALGGSAVQATGKLLGAEGLEQWGRATADQNTREAQAAGRPDLETAPWREGGASNPLAWLTYQAAKQVPLVAGMLVGGALAPEAVVPAGLARLGAAVPRLLGGPGMGAAAAAGDATALAAGRTFASQALGATAAGYPAAVGSLYQSATDREAAGGGAATRGDAAAAFVGGVPYAALDAVEPGQLRAFVQRGAGTGVLRSAGRAALTGALTELPTEAAQTAMEQAFRPDLSLGEKAANVVDAALTGAAVGGVFGGGAGAAGGMRRFKTANPNQLTDQDLAAAVDETLGAQGTLEGIAPRPDPALVLGRQGQAPERPFGQQSEQDLTSLIAAVGRKAMQEQATPQELNLRDLARQELEARAANPQPPAPEPGPPTLFGEEQLAQDPLRRLDDQALGGFANMLEARLAAGQGTRQDEMDIGLARSEMDRRARLAEDPEARFGPPATQGDLFSAEQLAQPPRSRTGPAVLTEPGAPEPTPETFRPMQKLAEQVNGRATQFSKSLQAVDAADFADQVLGQLEAGKASNEVMKYAEHFGFVSKDGQPRDLQGDLVSAQQALMQAARLSGTEGMASVRAAQEKVSAVQGLVALHQAVAERRAAGQAEAQPQAAPRPALDLSQPSLPASAPLPPGVQLDLPGMSLPRQAAPDTEPLGPPAPVGAPTMPVGTQPELPFPEQGALNLPPPRSHAERLQAVIADPAVRPALRRSAGAALKRVERGASGAQQAAEAVLRQYGAGDSREVAVAARERFGPPAPPAAPPQQLELPLATRGGVSPAAPLPPGVQPTLPSLALPTQQAPAAAAAPTSALPTAPAPQQLDLLSWQPPPAPPAPAAKPKAPAKPRGKPVPKVAAPAPAPAPAAKETPRAAQDPAPAPVVAAPAPAETLTDVPAAPGPAQGPEPGTDAAPRTEEVAPGKAPKWAASHAKELAGTVVYADKDTALVRAQGARTGNLVYAAVDRKTGQRTNVDITRYTGGLFPPVVKQRLVETRERLLAAEQANEQANPEGPFAGAAGNVVKSHGVDQRYADYLGALMRSLGLGDIKVFLLHPEDVRDGKEHYKLYGSYHRAMLSGMDAKESGSVNQFGPDQQHFYIGLKSGMPEGLAVETLTHEVGHLIQRVALDQATPETQAAIRADYERWFQRTRGMSARETILSLRNRETGPEHVHGVRDGDRLEAYWTSFNEWFADNVSKWATSSAKPVGLVQQFFQKLGDWLSKLARMIVGDAAPSQAVAKFLDDMGPGSAAEWLAQRGVAGAAESLTTPQRMSEAVKPVTEYAVRALEALPQRTDLSDKMTKASLGLVTMVHIREQYGHLFKAGGMQRLSDTLRDRGTIHERLSRLWAAADNELDRLEQSDKKAAQDINRLMQLNAEFEVDGEKGWDQQAWLHGQANEANLRKVVAEANEITRKLKQKQVYKPYQGLRDANATLRYAALAQLLHNVVQADPVAKEAGLNGFAASPMDAFLRQHALEENHAAARDYWKGVLDTQVAAVKAHLASGQDSIIVKKMLQDVEQTLAQMAQYPYFHLGRGGDFFVTFEIRKQPNGKAVDPQAQARVAKAIADAGFGDVQISRESDKPKVFVRLESKSQMESMHQLALTLQQGGFVTPKTVERGNRSDPGAPAQLRPEVLTELLQRVRADSAFDTKGLDEAQRKIVTQMQGAAERTVREAYLDMLPDTAQMRVMQERFGVPGYRADMRRNNSWRSNVAITALANAATAGKVTDAFTSMRQEVNDAKGEPGRDPVVMADVVGELSRREAERPLRPQRGWLAQIRAWNHAWFLGLSPAYAMIQFTQLGALLWPELSKRGGYVDAAKAIAKVTPTALKVAKAMMAEGIALGWEHGADAVITASVLRKAGVSPRDADFVMRAVNRANIDVGGASRELGRVSEGRSTGLDDLILRYAGATGYYAETTTRLIAALAAREMHGGDGRATDDYVDKVVEQAMLNYQNWNTGRLLSGPATKLATAFMSYQFQVLEKLWRELGRSFLGMARNDQEKREARRFLGAHMTAMTVLSGTLGLPFASVAARAVSALVDLFDDDEQPYDLATSWRGFLADVFGKDVGEVLARGAIRATGADIAQRVGEGDILPFSRFLTDRRKLEDRFKDLALDAFGSPASMAMNVALAFRDLADGNVHQALLHGLPTGLKSLYQAYRLGSDGYVDTKSGQRLPMTADAQDILSRALGFTPAEQAEYSEARLAQAARRGDMLEAAGGIRGRLATASERGDREALRDAMAQAQRFDRHNPGYAVLPTLGAALSGRAQARATAEATGTPIGTPRKDLPARNLTNYANY